jgi:hypothetical protein
MGAEEAHGPAIRHDGGPAVQILLAKKAKAEPRGL